MNTTTYTAEVDPQFGEMHNIVTEGGKVEKRAWFAFELAMSDFDSTALPAASAMYYMNEFVGSTKWPTYESLIDTLELANFISADDAVFLKSDFIMSDTVICHCDACAAKPFIG